MEQTFNERHAGEILKPCNIDAHIRIDERGVWPMAEYDETDELNLFRWRPARIFRGEPGASEVAATPMLPLPFTAHQLAAFMLEGVGALVSGFYGDYESGPDPASLNAIDADSNARTAIEQAYAAYREAKRTVGACPLALEAEADRARKAHQLANKAANIREGVSDSIPGTDDSRDRRARALASIAQQDAEMEVTALAWKLGYEKWLNAMVRQLLKPAPVQSPETLVTVVAGLVEPDKAGPVPVTTRGMADSFAGLHWNGEQWIKKLGDKPVWLEACLVLGRTRGEGMRQWNPVLIGAYLVRMEHVKANSVRAKFQTQPALIPWLDEWKTYEADNYPID